MKGTYDVEMTYNELKRMVLKEALADYVVMRDPLIINAGVLLAFGDAIEKTEEKEVE